MYTGAKDISRKGYVLEIDGTKTFGAWKEDSKCDSLVGLQEPSVFSPITPALLNNKNSANTRDKQSTENNIDLFVGIMCRSIPLKRIQKANDSIINKTEFTEYIHPIRYEPAKYIFDSTSDKESCYYNEIENQNLPKGVLGIQRCKFGAPFAVSFPHFLHADDWYVIEFYCYYESGQR